MNSVQLIVAGIAMSVGFAYGDGNHGKKPGRHADEHASALGKPGDPKKVTLTVEVGMSDTMRFSPASITAKKGETIRFLVRNSGQIKHEMMLGTQKELKEHYAMMMKMPEMEHADANMITVGPGKTGEVIWQFTKAGKVDFACLQPGHYDAGMKGMVNVAETAGAAPKTDAPAGHNPSHKH